MPTFTVKAATAPIRFPDRVSTFSVSGHDTQEEAEATFSANNPKWKVVPATPPPTSAPVDPSPAT